MIKNIPKLIFSVGLCLAAGIIGSFFTVSAIPDWYVSLNKPSFSPPNWIFGPAWTLLYILMGYSLYLVQSSKFKDQSFKNKALIIFAIQLSLNAIWSIIFFGMKNPVLAFVDIIALWVAIIFTIKAFSKINKLASYILYPYLAWVSFASILNLAIILLN